MAAIIVAQGKLYKAPVVLVNIYTPNWNNVQFPFPLILTSNLHSNKLILVGDLNSSRQTAGTLSRSTGYIDLFLQTFQILGTSSINMEYAQNRTCACTQKIYTFFKSIMVCAILIDKYHFQPQTRQKMPYIPHPLHAQTQPYTVNAN